MTKLDVVEIENTSHIVWAGFLAKDPDSEMSVDIACYATADGNVVFYDGEQKQISAHDGLLCATPNLESSALISGGEDGKVVSTMVEGCKVLNSGSTKWIDELAAGPGGAVAFSSGKNITVINGEAVRKIECERSVEGLAFAPKGMRLAVARYNGVELHWVNTNNPAQFLEWKGAHTGVMFSSDGKYVVSLMQENALHGWQLASGKNMRMSGYPSKVKSMSWSQSGKWLATSGAPACIAWPFAGKDGPMGKQPKELGEMGQVLVTHVSCNPQEDIVAIGYANGVIVVVKIDDGTKVPLRGEGIAAISSLGWDKKGERLCYGSQSGEAGVISLLG